MRRPILVLALVIAALAVAAPQGAAAPAVVDIGVAPSKLQLRLVPGQTSRSDLDLFNKGSEPVVLDVYLNDYTISQESSVELLPAGSTAGSAASWSSLNRSVLTMPAHSHRTVVLTIEVPQDAAIGTHTLAVIFRSRKTQTDGNVQYRPAVSTLLAAGVENADGSGLVMEGSAAITGVDVDWIPISDVWSADNPLDAAADWLFHPTVTAHTVVRNDGNTFFNVLDGGATFTPARSVGGDPATVAAPTYTILPDSTRTIDATWTAAPFAGSGDASVALFYNDTSAIRAGPASFTIIPWNLIMTVSVLLLLLLTWRIVRRTRRRRRMPAEALAPSPWLTTKTGV